MLSTRSSSSTAAARRTITHIHMANSAIRSIPVPEVMITKAPVLKFYDVKAEATIQCDASEKGWVLQYIATK